jgi:AbrB family looped-hinge helix DNA binding protein
MYNMTMSVTLSTKYQIVIPKDVRKQLGLKSGQKMEIKKIDENSIVLTKQLTADQYVEKYSGLLKDTPWITKKIDAAEYLRNERDRDR